MSYFDWLTRIVMPDWNQRSRYMRVLEALFKTEYYSNLKGDQNRARDGEGLRAIYEDDTGECCDIYGECRILEMMVALAIRCEEQIMYDPDEGDRTNLWFWEMFDNLGLSALYDTFYDRNDFREIICHINNHTYASDGYSGPFYIPNFEGDMREIELWYQLGYYMESKFL